MTDKETLDVGKRSVTRLEIDDGACVVLCTLIVATAIVLILVLTMGS